MSHEETFERDLTDLDVLGREIDSMAARVGERLRKSAFSGRTVTLKLRRYDFTTLTRSQTLPQPTDDPRQIAATARRLLADAGHRRAACGCSASGSRGCRSTRRATCSPRTIRRREPLPDVVTADDAPEAVPAAELPAERRWWPGQDVRHEELGAGWVWGRGLGRVTVRFEGPLHRAGPGAHAGGRRPAAAARRPARLEDARVTERSWWGWGTTDRALTDAECVGDGRRPARPARPPPSRAGACRTCRHRGSRRRRPCPFSTDPAVRASHTYGKAYRDVVRALAGRRRAHRRTSWRSRATEADVVAVLDWAGSAGGRRRPVRRRQLGRRAGSSTAASGPWRLARPHGAGPGAGGRPGQPGRPDPGRRARPGARGPAAPARPDAAALPAELRVLHARRLAGHPRRRPLRHRCTPTSTTWSSRCASSPRSGSASRGGCRARAPGPRPTGCSSARRARSASSPRRGCGCRTGRGPRRRPSVRVRGHDRRDGRRPGDLAVRRCTRRTAGCSTRARPRSPARRRRRARARARRGVGGPPGGRPAHRAARPGPSTTAARVGRRRPAAGTTPPTPGARRSCGCRTSATGWPG